MRRFIITTVLAGALFVVWAGSALAGTNLGAAAGDTPCGVDAVIFQTGVGSSGASYTVPSGNWLLSSWSTQANASGGQMAAVVVRPSGGSQYTVVGVSATETLTPSVLNTFTTAIGVKGGDILGFWASANANCAESTGSSGDTYSFPAPGLPKPNVGDTLSVTGSAGFLMDIAGTLSSSSEVPSSLFVCYSKWEQDGGAVFVLAQAEALLAQGYWLPTALPGTVAGGTNLGDYHLVCNPPTGSQPTGQYVGDGGDVLDHPGDAYYAIAEPPSGS